MIGQDALAVVDTSSTASTHQPWVRLAMVWLLIIPLAAFWATQLRPPGNAVFNVLPIAPKPGDPAVAMLRFNNPSESPDLAQVDLYVDGELLATGTTQVASASSKSVQYARVQPLDQGSRLSFAAHVSSGQGEQDLRSLPEYSPQVLSSFVSFAASSTTLMSSLISMSYYRASFGNPNLFDLGLVLILVMLALSIFAEATQVAPVQVGPRLAQLQLLSHRFRLVLISLYIIFGGIAVTRLALLFGVLS